MLKKDKKAMEDQKVVISIEELVEKERASLGTRSLTKVTLETFLQWKDRKVGRYISRKFTVISRKFRPQK